MAADMCGISKDSTKKAKHGIKNGNQLETPSKKRRHEDTVAANQVLDGITKSAIRRKIHESICKDGNHSVNSLRKIIDVDTSLPKISRTTFQKCLTIVGFVFDKRQNKFAEREDIVCWRRNYLRQIRRYRQQGKPIVYLDETLINKTCKSFTTARQFFIDGLISTSKIPPVKSGLSIVLKHGPKQGATKGINLAFLAKWSNTRKRDTAGDKLQKWVAEDLLPNIPDKCVIVMGNASYRFSQSDTPTYNAKKTEYEEWLSKKNIPWSSEMSRAELYKIIEAKKNEVKNDMIDRWLQEGGHEVLRLPPYHCDLNPIDLAWGKIKSDFPTTMTKLKTQEEQDKLNGAISEITPEIWGSLLACVLKTESSLWHLTFLDRVLTTEERLWNSEECTPSEPQTDANHAEETSSAKESDEELDAEDTE